MEEAERWDQGSTEQIQQGRTRKQEINVRKDEAMQLQSYTQRERCGMHIHEANKISQQHRLKKLTLGYELKSLGSENSLQGVWPLFPLIKGNAGVKLNTSLSGRSGRYQAVLSDFWCSIALDLHMKVFQLQSSK